MQFVLQSQIGDFTLIVFGSWMNKGKKKSILIISKSKSECKELRQSFPKQSSEILWVKTLEAFFEQLQNSRCSAAFIDVDSVSLENRDIRKVAEAFPDVPLFILSQKKSHPELQDAISTYIYACIHKPLKEEEIRFFLKSILKNQKHVSNTRSNSLSF